MIKKFLLFSLAILLSFTVITDFSKNTNPVEAAAGHSEIGFYEVMDNGGYIKVKGNLDSYDSASIVNRPGDTKVSIDLTSMPTYSNNVVKIPDIGSNESKLVLGTVYTLKLKSGTATVFSGDFKFVTKAIGNKDDLRVINLTDPKVAITGYYALENDIVLARGEENSNNVTMSYTTLGFRGTFDGMGHCITFCANTRGFFGVLGGKAVIKDVAFTDVTLYQNGLCPVIAKENSGTSGGPIYFENVYVRMKSGQLPCGGITQAGSIYHHINNVIVEAPGLNVNSENSGILTVGLLYGHDWAWWSTKTENGVQVPDIKTYSEYKENVYFIGNAPLKYYYDGRAQGVPGYFYNSEGHLNRYWMQGFATNEGVEEDMYQCKKVYKGTKKYLTSADMLADKTNDYSSFNSYWDTTTFGIPVWKTDIHNRYELFMSTEADHTTSRAYLQLGGKDEAQLGFGFNGISIDTDISYNIIEGEGVISLSSSGLVKALKVGEAKVEVVCKYNGKTFSKKFAFEVEPQAGGTNPNPNPNPGDDTPKGGCGTVNFTGTGMGGGALLIIGSFAFMMLRRKKYE